ncbi:HDIG domain-containing protein [Desulfurobacterium pacificum]|uniref:HDIG domain-containing protein n=1 Tax=Desulfurobacterium pacificum TaxID=240166 RepID=A0ABY1N9V8_9BACT|nr:HD-GYP domain-containing protein [Desulfurobacterium pacificum]SMP04302.1 HDIG domain-containing protein [Desulfurobacterium pacificum]
MNALGLTELLSFNDRNKLFAILNLAVAVLLAITFFIEIILSYISGSISTYDALKNLFLYYFVPGTVQLIVSHFIFHKNTSKLAPLVFAAPVLAALINVLFNTHIIFITELYFITINLLYIAFYGWKTWLVGVYLLMLALIVAGTWSLFPLQERIFFLFSLLFLLVFSSLVGIAINMAMKFLEVERFSREIYKLQDRNELLSFLVKMFSALKMNLLSVSCKGEELKLSSKKPKEKEFSLEADGLEIKLSADVNLLEEKFLLPAIEKTLLPPLLSYRKFIEEGIRKRELLELLIKTIEIRDPYTRGHSENVAYYSVALGEEIGLKDEELKILSKAALLHDIGKIAIPDKILLKPTPLTSSEREIIKLHPQVGAELLKGMSGFEKVSEAIRYHHERWDGSGYPEGLVGEEIPLLSRIMAVADVFDAVTSDRPYRKKLSVDEAIGLLRKEPLDPQLVEVAVRLFPSIYREEKIEDMLKESKIVDLYRKKEALSCFSCGNWREEDIAVFVITTDFLEDTVKKIMRCFDSKFFYVGAISDNQILVVCSVDLLPFLKNVFTSVKGEIRRLV